MENQNTQKTEKKKSNMKFVQLYKNDHVIRLTDPISGLVTAEITTSKFTKNWDNEKKCCDASYINITISKAVVVDGKITKKFVETAKFMLGTKEGNNNIWMTEVPVEVAKAENMETADQEKTC